MCPRSLVTSRIGFNRIPTEQRELLIEVGNAGEVRAEVVGQAAVPQPDRGINEGNSRLAGLVDAILVVVNEGPGIDVGLPLRGRDVPQVRGSAGQPDGRRKAVHKLVIPLVEGGNSPIAIGKA